MILIKNVRPLIDGSIRDNCNITIENGKFCDLLDMSTSVKSEKSYDMNGHILAAGYIDIHTHGGAGHDIMEGTAIALDVISEYHLSCGTTTYCPTTLTADLPTIFAALDNIREYKSTTARIFGAHLEGPFLSKKAVGAHPPEYILAPTPDNSDWVFDYKDIVSRVTIAPDAECADIFTSNCKKNNIQISLGHDASIDDEINGCIEGGATSVTHMTNCTSRPSRRLTPHKHLGLTEIGMIDKRLVCEVIADNRHVPNPLFKLLYDIKGTAGIALVSDSLAIAGFNGGEMYLGSGDSKQLIIVEDGVAVLPKLNTYAGSVTPISGAVKNIYKNVNLPLEDCITMGTLTPAKLMKMHDRGDVASGLLADFNILDDDGNIIHTFLGGQLIK